MSKYSIAIGFHHSCSTWAPIFGPKSKLHTNQCMRWKTSFRCAHPTRKFTTNIFKRTMPPCTRFWIWKSGVVCCNVFSTNFCLHVFPSECSSTSSFTAAYSPSADSTQRFIWTDKPTIPNKYTQSVVTRTGIRGTYIESHNPMTSNCIG